MDLLGKDDKVIEADQYMGAAPPSVDEVADMEMSYMKVLTKDGAPPPRSPRPRPRASSVQEPEDVDLVEDVSFETGYIDVKAFPEPVRKGAVAKGRNLSGMAKSFASIPMSIDVRMGNQF